MFRFIHSSDLHLGKRFGNMPEDLRGRLREARHGAIRRLADAAKQNGASVVLLAGDTFDTETPAADIRRQALSEMSAHRGLRWVILPGNHDSLQAEPLWRSLREHAPSNVILATEAAPIVLAEQVVLLPAPCTTRRPGRDLTEWMGDAPSEYGAVRIGLAHGAIQEFSEDSAASEVIAPDRAERAGLDYLALGDWHGALTVDEHTYYSGTPEPDRFKHDYPGSALAVAIGGPGDTPEVTPVPSAVFSWETVPLHLLAGEDGSIALDAALPPPGPERRQMLMRVVATGRTRLAGRAALAAAVEAAAPDFAMLSLVDDALETDCESSDLDRIDRAGALREAAEVLLAEAEDTNRSAAEREVAQGALRRLFSLSQALAP